jgi:hypothetical protein
VALLDALRGQKEKLTDKQRELQRKIYASMEMDAEFLAQDDKRRADLTKAISEDKELMAAKDKWATMDVAKRIALLQKTLKTECAIYGMPVPTVQVFEEPMPGDLGSFNSGTNVIRINVHPTATFNDFHDTIDTIVHENAHNYQGYLVTRLNEGLLNPGDPEYKQALMFASNSVAQSYVNGDEDHAIYKKQPLEDHAWKTGDGVKYALIALPPGVDDVKDSDEATDGKYRHSGAAPWLKRKPRRFRSASFAPTAGARIWVSARSTRRAISR